MRARYEAEDGDSLRSKCSNIFKRSSGLKGGQAYKVKKGRGGTMVEHSSTSTYIEKTVTTRSRSHSSSDDGAAQKRARTHGASSHSSGADSAGDTD